jgi:hypothetical protein
MLVPASRAATSPSMPCPSCGTAAMAETAAAVRSSSHEKQQRGSQLPVGGKGPGQLHTGLPCWRECTRHASKRAGGRQAGRLSSHQHRCDVALRPAVLLQVPGIVQLVADLQGAQQHGGCSSSRKVGQQGWCSRKVGLPLTRMLL